MAENGLMSIAIFSVQGRWRAEPSSRLTIYNYRAGHSRSFRREPKETNSSGMLPRARPIILTLAAVEAQLNAPVRWSAGGVRYYAPSTKSTRG
jgi:hypothetical protein